MSRLKKVLVAAAAGVSLFSAFLFAFTQISSSHPISKNAMAQSQELANAIGTLNGAILIGSRQKLVPEGSSCTKNTYLAFGDAGWAVVTSELSMQAHQADWNVNHLSLGWFSPTHGAC